MKPRPTGPGSRAPAHGYCERPPKGCPGCSGSHVNCEMRTFPPTRTAPAPASLYAWSEVSMQKFVRPTSADSTLRSFGQAWRRSGETGVGRLRKLDVHLRAGPLLIDQVQVARVGRAGRKTLGDAIAESGVGEAGGRDHVHGRHRHERCKRLCVIVRAGDVNG